jgi:hypothetical protein
MKLTPIRKEYLNAYRAPPNAQGSESTAHERQAPIWSDRVAVASTTGPMEPANLSDCGQLEGHAAL